MSRPREFDYDQVLYAAMDVFRQYGYQATSYELLTQRTKLKKQSLYCAFGDKRSLFEKALTVFGEEALKRFRGMLANGSTAEETLRYLQVRLLHPCDTEDAAGCLVVNSAIELTDSEFAHARVQFDKLVQGMNEGLIPVLKQGQREGAVTGKLSAEQLASHLTQSIIGTRVMIRAGIPRTQIQAGWDAAIEAILI